MNGRPRANAIALLYAAALATRSPPSYADTPEPLEAHSNPVDKKAMPKVAVDVSPANSPVVPLLNAELSELGIQPVEANLGLAASIVIHLAYSSDSLEVRITDSATGRDTVHEVFAMPNGQRMDPRTAVLHTVELLRWYLRFHGSGNVEGARPPSPPAPERLPEPPLPAASSADWRVGVLPLISYSPGGASLGLGAELDVLRRWGSFGMRLTAGTALAPNRLSVPEGSLELTPSWAGLESVALLAGRSLELGAGAALFGSSLHGTAEGGNLGRDDHLLAFAPFVDLRVRTQITPGFALNLGAVCLAPLRSSRLRVLGREIGRYGQVVVTLGLGVELTLF